MYISRQNSQTIRWVSCMYGVRVFVFTKNTPENCRTEGCREMRLTWNKGNGHLLIYL